MSTQPTYISYGSYYPTSYSYSAAGFFSSGYVCSTVQRDVESIKALNIWLEKQELEEKARVQREREFKAKKEEEVRELQRAAIVRMYDGSSLWETREV